jgi:hypothetical protein
MSAAGGNLARAADLWSQGGPFFAPAGAFTPRPGDGGPVLAGRTFARAQRLTATRERRGGGPGTLNPDVEGGP